MTDMTSHTGSSLNFRKLSQTFVDFRLGLARIQLIGRNKYAGRTNAKEHKLAKYMSSSRFAVMAVSDEHMFSLLTAMPPDPVSAILCLSLHMDLSVLALP